MASEGGHFGASKIYIWNLESFKKIKELIGHKGKVRKLSFYKKSRYLAAGSSDGNIYVWRVSKGEIHNILNSNTMTIYDLVVTLDGQYIISAVGNSR